MSIDFLYAAIAVAILLPLLALALKLDAWRRRHLIERRRRRRGGDITEELGGALRFYDDQPDPRELIG